MSRTRLFFGCFLLLASLPISAQRKSPVAWTLTVNPPSAAPGSTAIATLHAEVDPGWHLYSLTTPKGGPIVTTASLVPNPSVANYKIFEPPPIRKFDANFALDVETYEGNVDFLLPVELAKDAAPGTLELTAQVRYQTCNDKECLPPVKRTANAFLQIKPGAAANAFSPPASYREVQIKLASAAPTRTSVPLAPQVKDQGLLQFALLAFGFGLAAIFTPCVFPMIPITVSFFLRHESASRTDSLKQAFVFCLGIVVLFTALGLGVTAFAGPFGVVQLGSNPWVNGFIACVFFFFALSLLGAFEITLPSALLTRLDSASRKDGYAGTLIMGLTFSLTSFACVGPFVGPLLASSVQGAHWQPAVGMASFATGLAAPFFLLALFPSVLQKLPRSGGWMVRVKVVMGFILLAVMFKYLSNIDQVLQGGLLTRERFLAAWFVFFLLPGLYLLGFLRLEGIERDEELGLGRMLTAAAFLIFAVSLIPAMFGSRLGELDAVVPPPSEPFSIAGSSSTAEGTGWLKNQYPEALAKAKAENKLVLINFTGYACTNCHWMKQNMFPRPAVAEQLKGFVLVELYTDGTDDASKQNQDLEDKLFHSVSIPFYAVVDGDGKVLASLAGSTREEPEFLAFLRTGNTARSASL